MASVYYITNTVNGKGYIGVTKHPLHKRWKQHVYASETQLRNAPLQRAIRKYGADAFTIEEIYQHPDEDFILKVAERHFIEEYGTQCNMGKGYNMTWGGEGAWGMKHTSKTKAKMSKSRKALMDDEFRARLSKVHRGKKMSPEAVERNRKAKLGNTFRRGKKQRQQAIEKMRDSSAKYQYTIEEPDGTIAVTTGLREYCRNNGLQNACMYRVAKGERAHHKRYKVIETERLE